MKKLGTVLLLALACNAGCWSPFLVTPSGGHLEDKKTEKATRSARPILVTPDQVTDGNAHDIGKALEEELERAEGSEP